MKTLNIIEKILYLLIFAGVLTANISSALYGFAELHPSFIVGVLIAVIGVSGIYHIRRATEAL